VTDEERAPTTTTDSGIPAASDEFSLTVGRQGPTVLHDHYVVQKVQHFNRERVPERVVHAKGSGAHGFFEVTNDVSAFTKAGVFQPGRRTAMFARFSTVAGEQGYADTVRDPRGFALKFYTDDGNYDLVGNNTPVFFVRDASKFQDFIHSQKRLPDTGLRSNDMQWDFWTLSPESVARERASGRDLDVRPRHPADVSEHERVWQPHVLVDERGRGALLDQVPLQDRPGPGELHRRRGQRDGRRRPRLPSP
jgi:catalase